jgi:glutamate-ammonia-ligase adenylyltransferase
LKASLDIPEVLVSAAENHWLRFVEVVNALPDKATGMALLEACLGRQELKSVWAASDFIANSCIRNPLLLHDLISSGDLDSLYAPDKLPEDIARYLADCENEDDLHARLRKIRQREMVRIAWRDLAGMADLEQTMECVSVLADSCISQALAHHALWLSRRYGLPQSEHGDPAEMVVLGLGKLGGYELNYSSDVDLIFAYNWPGRTVHVDPGQDHISTEIDNQEFFIKLGRKIVTALDSVTREGFVFRTDMRLRPNGDSGPLVLSFAAIEHYYQTHGRNWERYALIKARVVAGDKNTGEELLTILNPFIYRKYLDFGAFDSIREMKNTIERELKQEGVNQNIKLGWGGIREIEFLVQSHQLIRGGREKKLQTQSLYQAITGLQGLGVIDNLAQSQLLEGYRFLRNSEHRLQMVADRQTQRLPESDTDCQRLAWSMGFDNWPAYVKQLDQHRTGIHGLFKEILGAKTSDTEQSDRVEDQLADVWKGTLAQQEAVKILIAAGFSHADSTPQLLTGVRKGRLYQAFSGIERDRIDRLMPLALQQAALHPDAERAMAAFVSVVEAIGRRSVYLSLLIENPIALKQLFHLCAASPWISTHIGRHPVILDELLNPLVDIRTRDDEDLRSELDHRLAQVDSGDEEGRMNTLREYHHAQVLRVAAADVSGVLSVDDVHHALTQLAEVLLQVVFADAVKYVEKKLEQPDCEAGVIAYGKFASSELGYNSDLDVVVCYESPGGNGPSGNNEAEHFYSRAGRRLIHLLSTRTQAGLLYELDMRLRPSGRSGTLVTSLSGFFEYQLNSAWTWEHQALVRSRVVVGSNNYRQNFESSREAILSLPREPQQLKSDIISMRRKMIDANCQSSAQVYDIKLDEGGIVDIEFLVQYWVLRHAGQHKTLAAPRTTEDSLAALVAESIIPASTGEQLLECYKIYLRHSLDLKLMDQPVLVLQDELLPQREIISAIWGETFS